MMMLGLKKLKDKISTGSVSNLYAAGEASIGWRVYIREAGKHKFLTSYRSNHPRVFKQPLPLLKMVDKLNINLNVVPKHMTIANIATRMISMMIVCQVLPQPANLGNIVPIVSEEYTSKTGSLEIPEISNSDLVDHCTDFITDKSIFVMQLKGSIDTLDTGEKALLKDLFNRFKAMGNVTVDDAPLIDTILDSLS